MVYLVDGIALAWIAANWSNSGYLDMTLKFGFSGLALVNAIGAAPLVQRWIGF